MTRTQVSSEVASTELVGLTGTLTLPVGPGPFPAAVLVHGSGPNDRDETVGANKIFKDLAEGRETEYGDVNVKIPWVRDGKLDVWMAGYGPKALDLIGRA